MSIFFDVCAVIGGLVLAVAADTLVWKFLKPNTSQSTSFGCASCDWRLTDPSHRRWWTLQPRYRWHCVTVHHDWPPYYSRRAS